MTIDYTEILFQLYRDFPSHFRRYQDRGFNNAIPVWQLAVEAQFIRERVAAMKEQYAANRQGDVPAYIIAVARLLEATQNQHAALIEFQQSRYTQPYRGD